MLILVQYLIFVRSIILGGIEDVVKKQSYQLDCLLKPVSLSTNMVWTKAQLSLGT